MAKYYGVQRSDEYLAHYGVRGMRWGVRKAKERHSDYELSKQFIKAQSHLNNLTAAADRKTNKEIARQSLKLGAKSLGVGAAGLAGLYGTQKLVPIARKNGTLGRIGAVYLGGLSGGVAGSGLGVGALALGSAAVRGYRASNKGHARAVKKRKEFQKEMQKEFSGTIFDNAEFKKENPYAFVGYNPTKKYYSMVAKKRRK